MSDNITEVASLESVNNNYCIFMLMNSRGLTELGKISEAIRA